METSPTIGILAAALAKAQGAMKGAKQDSDNPFFKSKYADLQSVWNACRQPLADNGLAVMQGTAADDSGVLVTTTLAHESGEWVRATLRMTPKDHGPQAIGSCISYARRYSLASMVGIYQGDDDAESNYVRDKHPTTKNGLPNITPHGEAWKSEDQEAARKAAEEFKKALKAGSDGRVYELHQTHTPNENFYIAISQHLEASERKALHDAVARSRGTSVPRTARGDRG